MRTKRALIYTMYFWPEPASIGPMATGLAEYLAQAGWDVTVVTGFPNLPQWRIYESYKGKIFHEERYGRLRIRRSWLYVPERPRRGLMKTWKRVASDSSMPITGILPALLSRRPDVVISISPPLQAAAVAVVLKMVWQCPAVTWIQDIVPDAAIQTGMMRADSKALRLAQKLEAFVYKNVDCIAAISEGLLSNLQAKGVDPKKLIFLPNWVDVEPRDNGLDRQQARTRMKLDRDDFVLMHVGAIAARTKAETLLQAMKLLETHHHIHLFFVGGGNLKHPIQELAAKMDLVNVHFLDPIAQRDALLSVLSASDLGIVCQKADISDSLLPSKLLTYMSCRLPVLGTVNASSETARFIHKSGGGIVTDAENADVFAEAVLLLEKSPEQRWTMGNSGYAFVRENFERSRVLKRFEAELAALLNI